MGDQQEYQCKVKYTDNCQNEGEFVSVAVTVTKDPVVITSPSGVTKVAGADHTFEYTFVGPFAGLEKYYIVECTHVNAENEKTVCTYLRF